MRIRLRSLKEDSMFSSGQLLARNTIMNGFTFTLESVFEPFFFVFFFVLHEQMLRYIYKEFNNIFLEFTFAAFYIHFKALSKTLKAVQ